MSSDERNNKAMLKQPKRAIKELHQTIKNLLNLSEEQGFVKTG